MDRIGDLMKELGFKKDSDEGVQKAFIKHLMRVADVAQAERDQQNAQAGTLSNSQNKQEQLSFDFATAEKKSDPVAGLHSIKPLTIDSTKVVNNFRTNVRKSQIG